MKIRRRALQRQFVLLPWSKIPFGSRLPFSSEHQVRQERHDVVQMIHLVGSNSTLVYLEPAVRSTMNKRYHHWCRIGDDFETK